MTFIKFVLWTCATAVASGEAVAGKSTICTPETSVKVESRVSKIDDWQELYASFRASELCNDESVVEVWTAYSQVVAGLFANHWEKSGDFFRLASEHVDFKRFVIRHLADETIPEDVLQNVRAHAKNNCGSGLEAMCKEIDGATH